MRGRLEAATEGTIAEYLSASADRQRVRAGFGRLFRECDVLLTPVSAGSPVPIGEEVVEHESDEPGFFVYNRHDSGTDGLRYYKSKVGFERTEVEWRL